LSSSSARPLINAAINSCEDFNDAICGVAAAASRREYLYKPTQQRLPDESVPEQRKKKALTVMRDHVSTTANSSGLAVFPPKRTLWALLRGEMRPRTKKNPKRLLLTRAKRGEERRGERERGGGGGEEGEGQ
jgi:hypothetical protein